MFSANLDMVFKRSFGIQFNVCENYWGVVNSTEFPLYIFDFVKHPLVRNRFVYWCLKGNEDSLLIFLEQFKNTIASQASTFPLM